jgi:hypothetical protein
LIVTFDTQYYLTTEAVPAAGGVITPERDWYNAGPVEINATPNAGYPWVGFSGALTGTNKPQTLTLDGPKSVQANFTQNVPATMTAPTEVTPLIGGQTQFTWSAGVNVTEYNLCAGPALDSCTYGDVTKTPGNLTATITLPSQAVAEQTVYVRLQSKISGAWSKQYYTYKIKAISFTEFIRIGGRVIAVEKQ